MRLSVLPCILSLAALAACDPAGPPPAQESSEGSASAAAIAAASCDAELYQYLINGPIELADDVTYPGVVRILGPDDFVTKDFLPHRLTITTRRESSGDKVGRVFCG